MVTGWLPDGSVSHGVRSTAALPSIRCRNSQARGAEGSGSDHSARICKVYPGGVVLTCPQWVVMSIKHPAKPCKALYMVYYGVVKICELMSMCWVQSLWLQDSKDRNWCTASTGPCKRLTCWSQWFLGDMSWHVVTIIDHPNVTGAYRCQRFHPSPSRLEIAPGFCVERSEQRQGWWVSISQLKSVHAELAFRSMQIRLF